ncbi:hypothetical protein Bca52824_017107 [Brassica carinata]|uniref:Uncharacterized protein n=1 Tax=Brassica carinata TaxID=52824 RepID=A0A8X7VMF7_BRACI|nr:hypothetical protein Bca52824_017107 [Brassica carinata]
MDIEWKHACTEMVMPMTYLNQSMFPPYKNDYGSFEEQWISRYGDKRPHRITTEFGRKSTGSDSNRDSVKEVWKQNARSVEPWRQGTEEYFEQHYCLVTKKGKMVALDKID